MLESGDYDSFTAQSHLDFFHCNIATHLGKRPIPQDKSRKWHSFMTDDYTPIELSWSWTSDSSLPIVRYSIEPIGKWAGTRLDPANLKTAERFIRSFKIHCPSADWTWYDLLSREILHLGENNHRRSCGDLSQIFFAFDLTKNDRILKMYLLPAARARHERLSNYSIVLRGISCLQLDEEMHCGLDIFAQYITSFRQRDSPNVELMGFDCVHPSMSRLKLYIRSPRTSFEDVIDALTLGGRLQEQGLEKVLPSLEFLWAVVLGLDFPVARTQPLPPSDHRTAGILYYYEFRPHSKSVKPKLYIPVRHYAKNDFVSASGFSRYLESQGMTLQGVDYLNAVRRLW